VFSREVFEAAAFGPGARSLEKEIFPALVPRGIYGMITTGYFVDIGVPEEYKRLLRDARSWIGNLGSKIAAQG
jgi:NDP-sugar pyrophosphorylase family protein